MMQYRLVTGDGLYWVEDSEGNLLSDKQSESQMKRTIQRVSSHVRIAEMVDIAPEPLLKFVSELVITGSTDV